jgi:hypothetical protein
MLFAVIELAPPSIVRLLLNEIVDASVIVPVMPAAKVMESPDAASAIAWRREPAPLSFKFVTVKLAARAGITVTARVSSRTAAIKNAFIREGIRITHFLFVY